MNFDHFPRRLFAALAASLLLHALALSGWSRPLPATPLAALRVVVAPAAPAVSPQDGQETPVAVRHERRLPPAKPRAPAGASPVLAVAGPAAAAVSPPPSVPVPASAPASGEAAPVPAAAATVAMAAANDGLSADGLRQYRIELAGVARRFRLYPAVARVRGWEGVAEVTVMVNAGLPVPEVQLAKSSGHAVLDDQAVAMLARAVAGTPLPESLRGRSFVVSLPVRFSLEE